MPENTVYHPIQQLPKNTAGNDYIIGDVHGSSAFESVLAMLKKNDRLFIVGDLLDRGNLSSEIISFIQKINQKMGRQVIFVVRGNHEDDFLTAMDFLNNGQPKLENKRLLNAFAKYLLNGGGWIFLKQKELIAATPPEMLNNIWSILVNEIKHLDYDLLNKIKTYFEALPYVLAVGDFLEEDRFIVVHADCYLPDRILFSDHAGNGNFGAKTKAYFTQARDSEKSEISIIEDHQHPRNDGEQALMYTGHTPRNQDPENLLPFVNEAVSRVCLDVGAYAYQQFIVVNHTQRAANIVSVSSSTDAFIQTGQKQIQAYLAKKFEMHKKQHRSSYNGASLFRLIYPKPPAQVERHLDKPRSNAYKGQ